LEIDELSLGNDVFMSYDNTFWNVFITFSTIGYGDFLMKSMISRILIAILAFVGICTYNGMDVDHAIFF